MTEAQYRWLLQIGLGRAITHARDHGVAEFRRLILDACLHCLAQDPTSEGTRATYTLDLLEFTACRDECIDAVLASLAASGDDWDARQRFEFAALLAEDGDVRARRAFLDSFPAPRPRHGAAIAIELLRFAGLDGLKLAVGALDEWRRAGHKVVNVGYLRSVGEERFGEEAARHIMAPLADLDPERPYHDELQGLGYEDLRPKLLAAHPLRLGRWGTEVDDQELQQAARGLLGAPSEAELTAHLHVFARRAFPLEPQHLLDLAGSGSDAVKRPALEALTHIAHPEVRALAFHLMDSRSPHRREAIALLARNYQPGDHEIALSWYANEADPARRHDHHFRLDELWRAHPNAALEERKVLTQYELGPCSWCRQFVVERLKQLGLLTPALRDECSFDANDDVRALVA